MKNLLKIFLIGLLLLTTSVVASQKQTDNIANISAISLYNIDKNSLQNTIKAYIKSNPNLKALKITEKLSGETYIELYKENEKIYYKKASDKYLNSLNKFTSTSKYGNEDVGTVIAYYKDITSLPNIEKQDITINLSQKEKEFIKNNPEVKVIKFFDEPPFTLNTDKKSGYVYELIEYLINSAGLNIKYVNSFNSYSQMLESLEKGEVDLLTTFPTSLNLGKESNIVKSKSILKTPFVLISKANTKKVNSLDELFGEKVAVVKGYVQDKHLSKYPKIKKVYVKNNEEGFKVLREGKANFYINNKANSEYVLNKSFSTDLKINYELPYNSFPPLTISFAMNGQKPSLVSILNKALEQIPYKKIKSIRDKWIVDSKSIMLPQITLTNKEKDFLEKHKTIRFTGDPQWLPFEAFDEKGNYQGIVADHLKIIERNLGLKLTYVKPSSWGEAVKMTQDGRVDMISEVVAENTISKTMNYTSEYIQTPLVPITHKSSNINSISDLNKFKDKKIAYVKDYGYTKELKKLYPEIKFYEIDTVQEGLEKVATNQLDIMILTLTIASYNITNLGLSNLQIVGKLPVTMKLGFGVRKDWKELLSIFNKAIVSIKPVEQQNIMKKWLGDNKNKVDIQLTKEEKKWIRTNKVTVGIKEWAPVVFSSTGANYDGITGDVLRLIVERTGLDLEVTNDTWDALLSKFRNKELDLLPATYYTDERATYGLYSDSYYKMLDYLYIREDDTRINSLEDLKGKTLAIVKDFGTIPKIRKKFPEITIIETRDQSDSIQRVLRGEVDALYDGQVAIKYRMHEDLIVGLKGIPQKSFKAAPLHMFSHIDKPILRDILNKALRNIPPYEINKIKSKWLVEERKERIVNSIDKKQNNEEIIWLLITAVGIFLLLLIILIVITRFISNDFVAKSFSSSKFRVIALIILSIVIFMLASLVYLTLSENKKSILQSTKSDLEFVLKTTQNRLDTWIKERQNFLIQMGRDTELIEATESLLKVNKDTSSLKKSSELKNVRDYFANREKEFGNLGFFIIDKDYISVGSRRDNNLGTKNLIAKQNQKLLERVFAGEAVFIPPMISDVKIKTNNSNEHTMFFAIPIKDKNNKVIAAMTQRLDVEGEFSEIIQSGRIGKSGESYLFSKDAFMLTKSRFREELIKIGLLEKGEKEYEKLQLRNPGRSLLDEFSSKTSTNNMPLTTMAKSAINMKKNPRGLYSPTISNIDGYRDYRGVNVFGAWIWYHKYDIGLATEIDESETLSEFYSLRLNLLIITGLTLLLTVLAIVMLIILGEKATRSIQKANDELNKLLSSFDENVIASKTDTKGNIVYASKAFCEISGYTQEELIGSPQNIVRHPDMPKELFKGLWNRIQNGKVWQGEVKNRKKDGGFYWVDIVITPEVDYKMNITGYSAIRQDITSKKEVEELSENLEIKVEERTLELKKSQEQFSSMAANVPGVIYRCKVDAGWTMIYISNEIETLSGYPVSDFINNSVRTFADIMHEDDIERVATLIQNQIDKGEKFLVDYRIIDKEGTVKWVRSQGQLYTTEDEEQWIDGVLFDVTEQRKLEQIIKDNTEQMTYVSQHANLGFWNFNPQIGDLYVNDVFVEMLGYDAKEVLVKGYENEMFKPFKDGLAFWEQLLHPDDAERTGKIITAHINGETELYNVEYRMRRNDGSWMWSRAVGRISEFDEDGKPIKFNGVNIDIDEAKRAQEAIEDQRQYTDSIMNSQSNIVISTDGEKLRTANKAFKDFFEVKDEQEFLENIGTCICDTFDTSAPNEFLQKMMAEETWIEYVYARPDIIHKAKIIRHAKEHIFSITSDRFEFAGETLKVAVFTDITEIENIRKNIEMILSNIMLPVLITSKKSRKILYANEYAAKQYEMDINELTGKSIDLVYTSDSQKDEIRKEVENCGFIENKEELYQTANGKKFTGLLSVKPINYNGEDAFIGMVVDITQQKMIEEEIREIHKHTQSSIEYASLIQHSLIPSNDLFRKYFDDYFTIWHPKDIVGGDIYLFEELRNEDECLLMVIDCTGHGVPGAFVTMLVKAIERQVAAVIASDSNIEVSPAWILKYFNQTMKKLLKQEDEDSISNAGFDGAVLYYNKSEEIVKFAGAELPLFYIEDGRINTIKGNRHSIGYKKSNANYEFKEHIIKAKEGMQFYLTSDGYLDQNGGGKGFPFGKKRFLEILNKYKDYSFADQQEVLLNELQEYQKDEERNDDISILGIKIKRNKMKKIQNKENWII